MTDRMERLYPKLPTIAWVYGLAGLIPFVGCAAADIFGIAPGQGWWRLALLIYSAIILSFLGGARWGLALARAPSSAVEITLSMAPSIVGFSCFWPRPIFSDGRLAAPPPPMVCNGFGMFERVGRRKAMAGFDPCSPPAAFYRCRRRWCWDDPPITRIGFQGRP